MGVLQKSTSEEIGEVLANKSQELEMSHQEKKCQI
jgi:hypothetical protein